MTSPSGQASIWWLERAARADYRNPLSDADIEMKFRGMAESAPRASERIVCWRPFLGPGSVADITGPVGRVGRHDPPIGDDEVESRGR